MPVLPAVVASSLYSRRLRKNSLHQNPKGGAHASTSTPKQRKDLSSALPAAAAAEPIY